MGMDGGMGTGILAGVIGLAVLTGCQEPRVAPAVSPLAAAPLELEPAGAAVTEGRTLDLKVRGWEATRPAVAWTATGGAIDAHGRFTASAGPGLAEVTARAGSRSGSVQVRVVPAPRGPIAGPAKIQAGAKGLRASVPAQPGCTYAWSAVNATLQGPADGPGVVFDAGAAGPVQLVCRVVNAGGTALKASLEIPLAPRLALAIAPDRAVVTAGNRYKAGFTLEGPAGTEVRWSVLEPGGGTVDGSGVYRAPQVPGAYTVQAQVPGEPGARAVLRVKVVPAPTGPLKGPAKAAKGATGLRASVPEQPGCTYTWTVEGGQIKAGSGTPRITFDAGAGSRVRVTCEITNEAGEAYRSTLDLPLAEP